LVYDLKLSNTGFATVLNPKTVYLVLIDETEQVAKEIELTGVSPKNWQPFAKGKPTELLIHTIEGNVSPGVDPGKYKIGLWIADNQETARNKTAYSIKFALDNHVVSHWTDTGKTKTVNIIGEIEFIDATSEKK
jgi:hypothetical protein